MYNVQCQYRLIILKFEILRFQFLLLLAFFLSCLFSLFIWFIFYSVVIV